MKMIDTFSKLTLSDLTIPSQNTYKEWGCQAPYYDLKILEKVFKILENKNIVILSTKF